MKLNHCNATVPSRKPTYTAHARAGQCVSCKSLHFRTTGGLCGAITGSLRCMSIIYTYKHVQIYILYGYLQYVDIRMYVCIQIYRYRRIWRRAVQVSDVLGSSKLAAPLRPGRDIACLFTAVAVRFRGSCMCIQDSPTTYTCTAAVEDGSIPVEETDTYTVRSDQYIEQVRTVGA